MLLIVDKSSNTDKDAPRKDSKKNSKLNPHMMLSLAFELNTHYK